MNRCINDILWGCCKDEPVRGSGDGASKCTKNLKTCGAYVKCSTLCTKQLTKAGKKVGLRRDSKATL